MFCHHLEIRLCTSLAMIYLFPLLPTLKRSKLMFFQYSIFLIIKGIPSDQDQFRVNNTPNLDVKFGTKNYKSPFPVLHPCSLTCTSSPTACPCLCAVYLIYLIKAFSKIDFEYCTTIMLKYHLDKVYMHVCYH